LVKLDELTINREELGMSTIAFIGLGNMGRPMVNFLLKAGHDVRVYARRPEVYQHEARFLIDAGAIPCSSPAQTAEGADFIITNVMSTDDVRDVLYLASESVMQTAKPGAICVDHSTIDPEGTRQIAKVMSEKGVLFVDAPVSGGVKAATEGGLVMMLGGAEQDVEKVKAIVSVYAKTITHIGGVGDGQVAKLCNQIAQVINIQGIAESMRFAAANNANLQKVFEAISGGMAGSRMLDLMGPKMVERNFKAGIEARLHAKDFFLVKDAANRANIDLPALQAVAKQLEKLMDSGWDHDDTSSLLRVLEA
jgi:3-hydroxyisobutyrate dehydrogenase-like beta-hydroxyacid dehydrogenase